MASTSPSPSNVTELKASLRKQMRSRLSELSIETMREESQLVWDRLFQLDVYKQARSVGVFLSMPKGEILTDALLADAVDKKKRIYVPQVGENFEKSDMELVHVDVHKNFVSPQNWPKNRWGIPEPPSDSLLQAAKPGDLDLVIVPGLAFDEHANRLGQGKGYYDRFIARMLLTPDVKHPVLVAVGLQCQMLRGDMAIPTQEYDQPMDIVVVPGKLITRH
jgi:5-formyltetrahydrofolate cyclo-ligase